MPSLAEGDGLVLASDEVRQPAELVAAGLDGRIDTEVLGAVADSDAGGLKAMLAAGDLAGLMRLREGIAARRIDIVRRRDPAGRRHDSGSHRIELYGHPRRMTHPRRARATMCCSAL